MMFCQSPAAELRTWESKSKIQNLSRLGLMVKFSVHVQISQMRPLTEKYICSWRWFKSFLSEEEAGCPRPSIHFCVLPTARVSGDVANQTKLEFCRAMCGRITMTSPCGHLNWPHRIMLSVRMLLWQSNIELFFRTVTVLYPFHIFWGIPSCSISVVASSLFPSHQTLRMCETVNFFLHWLLFCLKWPQRSLPLKNKLAYWIHL